MAPKVMTIFLLLTIESLSSQVVFLAIAISSFVSFSLPLPRVIRKGVFLTTHILS